MKGYQFLSRNTYLIRTSQQNIPVCTSRPPHIHIVHHRPATMFVQDAGCHNGESVENKFSSHIGQDIVCSSMVVETNHYSGDPACSILEQTLSSRSRRSSQCAVRRHPTEPRRRIGCCSCRPMKGLPRFQYICRNSLHDRYCQSMSHRIEHRLRDHSTT